MKKIGLDFDTKIQVCSCKNFIIIKGQTSSKEIIKLSDVLNDFNQKYQSFELESKNIIDLIEYNSKIKLDFPISFSFRNDVNCSLPHEDDSFDFFSTSFFPYGYSFSCYRSEYYYFKNIVYNIPSNYPFNKITFKINKENQKIDFDIEDDYRGFDTDFLKSIILDCFDFDLNKLISELKIHDLDLELLNPSQDIEILKNKNNNFIIL